MRIGFFTDSYLPHIDGIAISTELFRKSLEKLGHEVYIFCPKWPKPYVEPSQRIHRFKSIPAFVYPDYRVTFPFGRKHHKLIAELDLDVIHVHTPLPVGAAGLRIARRLDLPVVYTSHVDMDLFVREYKWVKYVLPSPLSLVEPWIFTKNKPTFTKFLDWKAHTKAWLEQFDFIVSPSKKVSKSIDSMDVHTRKVIIPTGFDFDALPGAQERTQQRKRLGLTSGQIVFISTSRLVKEKRIDFLVQAFARAVGSRPDLKYLIVGDGPERSKLEHFVSSLGVSDSVYFLGMLDHDDVIKKLQAADIMLNACLRECQPLVINEAAASGLPIIALEEDIGPVVSAQKTALIPKNTLEDYAQAMQELADSSTKRQQFGGRAKELALANNSQRQAKRLEELYIDLINKK